MMEHSYIGEFQMIDRLIDDKRVPCLRSQYVIWKNGQPKSKLEEEWPNCKITDCNNKTQLHSYVAEFQFIDYCY